MFSYYFQGLALGAAMILPLGPQNAFVMNQGIRRQYHIMIALLCAISDLVLICAGIFGGSALLMQSPWLLALVTWGGVAFLLWYGFGAFKTAMSSNIELASAEVLKQGRWKIIATMLAVTWLNPHVYLDTFVLPPLHNITFFYTVIFLYHTYKNPSIQSLTTVFRRTSSAFI